MPVGPEPLEDSILDIELKHQLRPRRQPIDLAKGSSVLGRQRLTRYPQYSAGMEGNPRKVDRVGVRLHQYREMQRQLANLVMLHRSRPDEVKTSQPIHHRAPNADPEKGIRVADGAGARLLMGSMSARDAEVADASTDRRRRTRFAFKPAGRGHWASPSRALSA